MAQSKWSTVIFFTPLLCGYGFFPIFPSFLVVFSSLWATQRQKVVKAERFRGECQCRGGQRSTGLWKSLLLFHTGFPFRQHETFMMAIITPLVRSAFCRHCRWKLQVRKKILCLPLIALSLQPPLPCWIFHHSLFEIFDVSTHYELFRLPSRSEHKTASMLGSSCSEYHQQETKQ